MRTSDKGKQQLKAEEGVVLRAYRCPAGVWTISAGLTASSGVIKPVKGMEITEDQSDVLIGRALERNYEPRVSKRMGDVAQHVFDGAVLFDWNTGAIVKASWVGAFLDKQMLLAESWFMKYVLAAGKVVRGLELRRKREWKLIRLGEYTIGKQAVSVPVDYIADLRGLGYRHNDVDAAVKAFQQDHGLRVDGIVGPATRATIARVKSDAAAAKGAGAGGAGGAAAGAGAEVTTSPSLDASGGMDLSTALWAAGGLALMVGLVLGAHYVWSNRGPIFAGLPEPVKDWFEERGIVLGRRVRT